MKILLRLLGCVVGFVALALPGALAQQPAFSIQLVSTFDYPGTGNQTRPQKINDNGDIAGVYVDSGGISHGFTRLANGRFSAPIDDPNSPTPFTEGRGINNSRVVCGDYTDSAGAFEGFFLTGHTFTNYDIEPTFTIVLGINNVGDFLAYQINASNTSCGYYIDSSAVTHGYYRDPNGTIHGRIDPAGSTGTIVFGNNDANFIVGRYADAAALTHGFLFLPSRRTFVIYDFPGATFTSLNGINNRNLICGRYTDPNTGIDHGIIARVVRSADSPVVPLVSDSEQMRALPHQPAANTNPAY